MKKRVAAILLALAMIAAYMPALAFASVEQDVIPSEETNVVEESGVVEEAGDVIEDETNVDGELLVDANEFCMPSCYKYVNIYINNNIYGLGGAKVYDDDGKEIHKIKTNRFGKIGPNEAKIVVAPNKITNFKVKSVTINGVKAEELTGEDAGKYVPGKCTFFGINSGKCVIFVEYEWEWGPLPEKDKYVKINITTDPNRVGGADVYDAQGKKILYVNAGKDGIIGDTEDDFVVVPKNVIGMEVDSVTINGVKAIKTDKGFIPGKDSFSEENVSNCNIVINYCKKEFKHKTKVNVEDVTITYGDDFDGNTVVVKDYFGNVITDPEAVVRYVGLNYNSTEVPTDAGIYAVYATYMGSDKYYASYGSGKLVIKPKQVLVSLDSKIQVYGDKKEALTYTVKDKDGTVLKSDIEFYPFIVMPAKDVGTYLIYGFSFDSNYYATVNAATYTITKRPLTYTWTLDGKDQSVVEYDGKEHVAEVTVHNVIEEDREAIEKLYSNNVNTAAGIYTAKAELHSKPHAANPKSEFEGTPMAYDFTKIPGLSEMVPESFRSFLTKTKLEVIDNYEPLTSEFSYEIIDLGVAVDIPTGDDNNVVPFAILAVVALVGAGYCVSRRKENEK